jgi:hypothetical protein
MVTVLRVFVIAAATGIALTLGCNAYAGKASPVAYVQNSLSEAFITNGPWSLHQMAGINPHDASGIVPPVSTPYAPPTTAYGTPYKGYCQNGQVQHASGANPMQPYYFPFVRKSPDGRYLEGFFDYRPRNEQEAAVAAVSSDGGKNWIFRDEALALNPYCPADVTDPDNNNVLVNGVATPYGSDPNNAADNGLGHPFVMTVNGNELLYQLNRANGHIDSDPLVIHELLPEGIRPLASLPALGYVSPLKSLGYPTLEASAKATIGLQNPDAILGATRVGAVTAVVYIEKQLGGAAGTPVLTPAQTCPNTPSWALSNQDTTKAKKANDDVITIRVATTSDGITFNDVGAATGLEDPFSVSLNAIRWLGSGSIIRLSNGHYGMFFGAGNCLDNDSDGFHFIGYAQTANPVKSPSDLLAWNVVNGFDNPILSTDSVTDPVTQAAYPANAPLVDVTGADILRPGQVAPWIPPVGLNTNFFSGRVYDPQAIVMDDSNVTIVFAGYNTPQPSSNLGDYRTIGRLQVRFPPGYLALPENDDDDHQK